MVWGAPDHIWHEVTSLGEKGLLCPLCFDRMAKAKGIVVAWIVANELKEGKLKDPNPPAPKEFSIEYLRKRRIVPKAKYFLELNKEK